MPSREQFLNLNILYLQVVWIELAGAQGGESRCFMHEEALSSAWSKVDMCQIHKSKKTALYY